FSTAVLESALASLPVKSELYSQGTVQGVLARLDSAMLLHELGLESAEVARDNGELRTYCPICGERSQMTLVLTESSRSAWCTNPGCRGSAPAGGGGSFLNYYAAARGGGYDDAVAALAGDLDVPLVSRAGGDGLPEGF